MKAFKVLALVMLLAFTGCAKRDQVPPATDDPLFSQACEKFLAGDYSGALSLFNQFRELPERSFYHRAEIALWIGKCHLSLGNVDQAQIEFYNGLQSARDNATIAQCHEGIGDTLRAQETFHAAIREYNKALEVGKGEVSEAAVYYKLGVAQLRCGAWLEGRGTFAKMAHRFPNHPYAQKAKAILDSPDNFFSIQIGATRESSSAEAWKSKVAPLGKTVAIVPSPTEENMLLVRVGRYSQYKDAKVDLPALRELFKDALIVP